jgi:protein-L-isoaspartate(D-aspartate) O-methyltransferase
MSDAMLRARDRMVRHDLEARGIHDPRVLAAMGRLPRERFLPAGVTAAPDEVYRDSALPIGRGQTLSQPFMVAAMTQALGLQEADRVLEVGTGTGYQTAVLAAMAGEVWSIERDPVLAEEARVRLGRMGFENIRYLTGDGTKGWAEGAPYDAILVTAGGPAIPPALLDQLAPGGRLVAPVGSRSLQQLLRVSRDERGRDAPPEILMECRFVPLVGEEGWSPTWSDRLPA